MFLVLFTKAAISLYKASSSASSVTFGLISVLVGSHREEHDHDDFDSFVVPLAEVGDPAMIAKRIAGLAEAHSVLRVKGFAAVAGKPMRLLIQAVGPRVSHYYDRPWGVAEDRQGSVVVIGLKGLDRDAVARSLAG